MEKGFRALLRRALIGGALGGFVLVAILLSPARFGSWDNWLGWLIVGYALVGLPYGTFIGGIVGAVIWIVHDRFEIDLGAFSRATIGVIIGVLSWSIVWSLTYRTGYVERTWQSTLLGLALFGIATGAIPGILVGHQRSVRRDSATQGISKT